MKLKLQQLVDSSDALARLSVEKLDVTTAYKVTRVLRIIRPELEQYFKARNDLIIQKYGKPKGQEGAFEIDPTDVESLKGFHKEDKELTEIELDLPIQQLALSQLKCNISGLDLFLLEWLIKDDVTPPEKAEPASSPEEGVQ